MTTVKYGALACALMMPCAAPAATTLTQSATSLSPTLVSTTPIDTDPAVGSRAATFANLGNQSIATFDLNQGVLTGATITGAWASGSVVGSYEIQNGTGTGVAASRATLMFVGLSALQVQGGQARYDMTSDGITHNYNYALFGSQSAQVSSANLSLLTSVGASTTSFRIAPLLQASFTGTTGSSGSMSAKMADASVRTTIDYSYLKHSVAAFDDLGSDQLTVDFGTVRLGSGDSYRMFRLKNLGDANTVDLDLDHVMLSDSSVFSSTMAPEARMAAGGESREYSIDFSPIQLGQHSAVMTIRTSDADFGIGMRQQVLTVNVLANVIAGVPEPASWALMIGGFGLTGARARTRRRSARANVLA